MWKTSDQAGLNGKPRRLKTVCWFFKHCLLNLIKLLLLCKLLDLTESEKHTSRLFSHFVPWLHSDYIDYILTACWRHSDYIPITFRLHYDYILATVWLHSNCIPTTFWLHSSYILAAFWLHSGYLLATIWLNFLLHFGYISATFWLHSDYYLYL